MEITMRQKIIDSVLKEKLIVIVRGVERENLIPLAEAMYKGGIRLLEITYSADGSVSDEDTASNIKMLAEHFEGRMFIGAGTVLTTEQVDRAIAAGAQFIVSPGFNPVVVQYCIEKGIVITPGISSPSEIEQAIMFGLEVVKFFPAEASGGLAKIKAMAAPYTAMKFMPTGGINAKNINSYLDCDKILACGGSWMVKDTLINEGKFDEIEALTKEAVANMLGFKLAHLAINCEDEQKAKAVADMFTLCFNFSQREIPVSYFCTEEIEVMKFNGRGTMGHIAVKTNYMDKAVAYLERKGIALDYESAQYDEKGNMTFIYIKDEFGGFAVHLCL